MLKVVVPGWIPGEHLLFFLEKYFYNVPALPFASYLRGNFAAEKVSIVAVHLDHYKIHNCVNTLTTLAIRIV